jgi:serine/threonine-protein kinase RsbW
MQEITLTLPMLPDMELTASKMACAVGEHIRMSADKIDEMRMAVVEACINAFEHSDAQAQKVELTFVVMGQDDDPKGLQITIRDRGVGFLPETVEEPVLGSKLQPGKSKRGWGLKIIRGLMDEVDIQSGREGTTVVMRKLR